MTRSHLLGVCLALLTGFVGFFALVVVHAVVTDHVDPGARIAAFLSGHPHRLHPLRFAAVEWSLVSVAGLAVGGSIAWLARTRRMTGLWLMAAFAVGYLIGLELALPSHGVPVSALAQPLVLVGVAALCVHLLRSRLEVAVP